MKQDSTMNNSVSEWFRDKHILVTGATGFMGKVLVEKLLRSCPNIAAIYILIRPKRGKDSLQRLEDFVNSPVFDKIRDDSRDPQKDFEKIHCISGDIILPSLNMSESDQSLLKSNINIVFHMAANVRFDQPLKDALLMNTGGSLNVLRLAETFQKLQSFVHVSTSYCHCEETALEERFYEATHSPEKLLEMVEWLEEELIVKLTPGLIGSAPNTYSYTKCLTEQLVAQFKERIPVAITRPSIVTASWKEPMPGWIENMNGPTGLLIGGGKGVIRSLLCNSDYPADLVPVDVAINQIILVAWQRGNTITNLTSTEDVMVVNVCNNNDNPITWGEALKIGTKHLLDNPFSICLWYPNGTLKTNYYHHIISVFLFHIIPAYLIDFLMVLFRKKTFLVQTQKRIQNGLKVLQYYTVRKWVFHNDKIKKLSASLSETDRQIFFTDMSTLNWNSYILDYILGARKHCLHEEPRTIPTARKTLRRLFLLDCATKGLLILFFVWLFWHYAQIVLSTFGNLVENTIGTIRIRN